MSKKYVSCSPSCGGGFAVLLTTALVVLKLLGHINWSWWWVFSPIWISLILILCILSIMVVVAVALNR